MHPERTAAEAQPLKHNCVQAQFLRLKSRRGRKKASVAVAASMLTVMFHMLRDGTEFHDLGDQHFAQRDCRPRENRRTEAIMKNRALRRFSDRPCQRPHNSSKIPTMSAFRSLMCVVLATSFAVGCDESSTPSSPSPPSTSQLAGDWTVVSIRPIGQAEQPTPTGAIYSLTIADGRMSTRLDCNTCSGAFVLSGQTLTAGPVLACTRAACPTMAFGDTYVSLLSGESTVALTGSNLVLSSARGILRLTR